VDNFFKLKSAIAVLLFLISTSVIADTYPTVPQTQYPYNAHIYYNITDYQNAAIALKGWGSLISGGSYHTTQTMNANNCQLINLIRNSDNFLMDNAGSCQSVVQTCPSGGTVSGTTCINVPACISPTIRKSVSPYSCFTPVECRYPESDNGTGICANNTCPVGQTRNPVTNLCQVSPTCGATETLNLVTNLCELNKIKCPGHSHASTDNSQCLADAPNVCPAGQHDDGTYTCVANDPTRCTKDQYAGFINGIPQCINKSNLDQQTADKQTIESNLQAAIVSANNAAAALAADPTNAVKQESNTISQSLLDAAKAASDQVDNKLSNDALKNIDQTLKSQKESNDKFQDPSFTTPIPDVVPTTDWTGTLGYTDVTGSCPAPISFTVHGYQMSMSFQQYCNFATYIRPVVLALASLSAGMIIIGM
jgi:Neisseria meningitidis TspB protein